MTAGKSDFNHSENPHSAALWASKKVRNIYVFLFFPPKGKVIKITHKLSPLKSCGKMEMPRGSFGKIEENNHEL